MSEIEIIYSPQRPRGNLTEQTPSFVKSIPATFYDANEQDYSTPAPASAFYKSAARGATKKSVSSASSRSTPTPKESGISPWKRRGISSPLNNGGGKVISPPTSPRAKEEEEDSFPLYQRKRYSYPSNNASGEGKGVDKRLLTAHRMPPTTTVFDRIYGNYSLSQKGGDNKVSAEKRREGKQVANVNEKGGIDNAASFSTTSPQRLRNDRVYSPPRGATPPACTSGGVKTPFRVTSVHTHNKLFSNKTVSMAGAAPPPASDNAEVTGERSSPRRRPTSPTGPAAPSATMHNKGLRERNASSPSSPTTYKATRVSGRTMTKQNSEAEENDSDDAVIESMEEIIVVVDKGARHTHRRPNGGDTTDARKAAHSEEVRDQEALDMARRHQRKEALVTEEELLERAKETVRREEYRRRLADAEKKEREAADRLAEARDIDRYIAENYLPPLRSASSPSRQEEDSEDKSFNRTRTLGAGGGSLHRSAKAAQRHAERRGSLEAHQVSAIRHSDLSNDYNESIASLSDASLQHALSFVTARASPRKKHSLLGEMKSVAAKESSPLKKSRHPRTSAYRGQSSGSDTNTDDECSTIADSLENTSDDEAQERRKKKDRLYIGSRTTDPFFVSSSPRKNKRLPTTNSGTSTSKSTSKRSEAEHHSSFYNHHRDYTSAKDDEGNPLLFLSRESLTEQLMRYAKAFERERSARIEAAGRVSELSKIADTSTSLAETSDRNCKAVLSQLDEAGMKLGDASSRLTEALEENTKLRAFLIEAKARFDETLASNKALRETNVELESLLRPLQKDHEALRHEHDRHQQEMLALKARHDLALQTQRVKHEGEVEHVKQTVDRLERENKELRGVMSDLESAHQRERKEQGQKLSDAYAEADKAKAALEAVRVELRNVAASAENERDSHSRQEHIYVGEIESLKSRISSLSGQYEQCSLRKKELEHEMVAVREAHNAMTVKVKTTLAELESTDSEKESRKMLERQNAEMERQIMELRATLQTFMTARRLH